MFQPRSRLLTLSALLGLPLAGVGCAHAAAPRTATVAQAPVAPATPNPTSQEDDSKDVSLLLSGAVAHFDFDRDQLTDEGQDRLQKVAAALKAHPKAQVRISGHCDELGTEEYNLALGQRRAEVAKKYLAALGVDPSHIDTISYGEERPANAGHDEKAWAANRRDEVEPLSTNK